MPSGFILDNLLKYYFIKISSVIIKKNILKNYKFNSEYNIIGDYDLILRIAEKFKGMVFQKKFLNIKFTEIILHIIIEECFIRNFYIGLKSKTLIKKYINKIKIIFSID